MTVTVTGKAFTSIYVLIAPDPPRSVAAWAAGFLNFRFLVFCFAKIKHRNPFLLTNSLVDYV